MMLKAAIEKILDLAQPVTIRIGDETFLRNGDYVRLNRELLAHPMEVGTLSAVLDYIVSGADEHALDDKRRYIIHVRDHKHVNLCMELNGDKHREVLLQASTEPARFREGVFMDVETFIINMQQFFVDSENVRALVQLVSNVTDSKSVQQTDDGSTQSVVARSGLSMVRQVNVPNPVSLAPYRTFREIEQPESPFVFRLRGGENGVTAALFSADGNAWQYDAVQRIKDYFICHIPREMADKVIILA